MKSVFIILYNGSVSSEGYDTIEKAIKFVEDRAGKPQIISNSYTSAWAYVDKDGNIYSVKEINIV